MYRKIAILMYVVIGLLLLVSESSQADVTHWRHNPARPGNWFSNANWSAGVPGAEDTACIYNGGTAVIARGYATAGNLNIGTVLQPAYAEEIKSVQPFLGTGAVRQRRGVAEIKGHIHLSGSLRKPSSYTLIRGRLSAGSIVVGYGNGSGRFNQVGGANRVRGELKIGDLRRSASIKPNLKSSLGIYRLRRGLLSTERTSVGVVGQGVFVQRRGVHKVKDILAIGGPQRRWPWLQAVPIPIGEVGEPVQADEIMVKPLWPKVATPLPLPSKGRYVLRGGRLTARRQDIRRTGTMKQRGGKNKVDYLSIHRGGRYNYLGGRLRINAGLDLDGKLNFGGKRTVLSAGSALLNFSRGDILNSRNAVLRVGSRSLTIFAKDFNPKKEFRRFHTDGLVHFAGNDLVLSPRKCFTGWGTIDDHVISSGWIYATKGGGIDLRKGLFVRRGSVDLGEGRLAVRNGRSGIKSGRLSVGSMTVGGPLVTHISPAEIAPTLFRQSGGSCNAGRVLRIGYFPFRKLYATNAELELAEATPLDIGDLLEGPLEDATAIPYPIPSATYHMSGGRLSAGYLCLYGLRAKKSKAQFVQVGGDVSLKNGVSVYGYNAGYTISGGRLRTPVLRIGSRYAHSGGRLAIRNQQARIEVSRRLSFGADSRFTAVDGSTIHITGPKSEANPQWFGSTVENFSTDPVALAGLENLTLIFEGGDEFTATFEVAGEDMGATPEGLFENFALDTLQIGGEDVAMVQLVDLFDNQPGSELPEALYVRNLFIGAGSSLDTNGLALYCISDGMMMQLFDTDFDGLICQNDLAALGYEGGGGSPPAPIPEPATALLLLSGGVLAMFRQRRKA